MTLIHPSCGRRRSILLRIISEERDGQKLPQPRPQSSSARIISARLRRLLPRTSISQTKSVETRKTAASTAAVMSSHTRRRTKRRFSLPPLLSITVISQEQARASSRSFARSPSWALKRRVFSLTHSSSQSSKALRAEALRRLSGNAPNTSTLTRPFICSTILFIS